MILTITTSDPEWGRRCGGKKGEKGKKGERGGTKIARRGRIAGSSVHEIHATQRSAIKFSLSMLV